MGPPLISGGNTDARIATAGGQDGFNGAAADQRRKRGGLVTFRRCKVASMGPPLISGGNDKCENCDVRPILASMGPPLISGGNGINDLRRTRAPISFNGAAADQRRKRRRLRPRSTTRIGFNGAAADQRRKLDLMCGPRCSTGMASMGPPLISGGNWLPF